MKSSIIKINPSADHDTIIRVETKVDQLILDLRNMSDTIVGRLNRAETKIDRIDLYHATHPLEVWEDNSKWVSNYRANFKLIIGIILFIISILSSLIVFALKKLLNY